MNVPLDALAFRLVNGRLYGRLLPLSGAERDATKAPPKPILWLVLRLHPEFRKRNRNARAALRDKIWRRELARWNNEQRAEWQARNSRLNTVTPAELDDAALVAHLRECFDDAAEGHEFHFELHGTDLAPLGDLIAHCKAWNITPNEAMATLQGASPASVAPTGPLAELAKLVADAPTSPRTLDDIRALGPAARDALDEFLVHRPGARRRTARGGARANGAGRRTGRALHHARR